MKFSDLTRSSAASNVLFRAVCAGCICITSALLFSGCASLPASGTAESQQQSRVGGSNANAQGLIRLNIAGLPSAPNSMLSPWPKFDEACDSRLKTASRAVPTKNYVSGERVDALVASLRETIRLRELTINEYILWQAQTERIPDYERVEWMEIKIRSWKSLGWKIDDPAFQRRFIAESGAHYDKVIRQDADTMRYYVQGRRIQGQSAEVAAAIAALRNNRDFLERWQYELGNGSIAETRNFMQNTNIELLALGTLAKSNLTGTELKAALRDLDEFSELLSRCFQSVPRFSDIRSRSLPPPIRTDAAQNAVRLSEGQASKALFEERKSIHSQLTRRAIDATSKDFLAELKQTRKSQDVPLALVSFYGVGLLASAARGDPTIAPAYEARLSQLQAAERAAVQAELAKLRAIEARNAAARAEDLKRRIAGNLPPTLADVSPLLMASSASKTRANLGGEIEFEGTYKYSMYGSLFANRIKTGEHTLEFSDLVCRPENSRHLCTWSESSEFTNYYFFGAIKGAPDQGSTKRSGVFRWDTTGLVSVGPVDVDFIRMVTRSSSGGGSGSTSNNSRNDFQDQFMERQFENRQNYYDRTQGMGSNAPAYNPAKRY